MFLTIALGLVLLASGLTTLLYLVRFIFSSTKVDTSHLIELHRQDEPELFGFIKMISREAGAKFPKKIFISHEVNASVFYNSNFWSMFFPVRKNLIIGFGLINTVSKQELKAILAHEFGHFSQKSMKVGSYVYHVNQIIYNMVNREYISENWTDYQGVFYMYIAITKNFADYIIKGIQEVLKSLYKYVNINYMALSREMEFHADVVAANVAGSDALCESLLRLEFSNYALESVFSFYDNKATQRIISQDIYKDHLAVNHFLRKENGFPLNNGLPSINLNAFEKYNKSKLNIADQWASHPTTKDRITAIRQLNIVKTETDNMLATLLFKDKDQISNLITNRIFTANDCDAIPQVLNSEEFASQFVKNYNENSFDERYNGFYNINNPIVKHIENIDTKTVPTYSELFTDEKVGMNYELAALKNDEIILQEIQNGNLDIKTFDYDGKKHHVHEAYIVMQQIKKEIISLEEVIDNNNILVYQYYLQLAEKQNKKDKLQNEYIAFNTYHENYQDKIGMYNNLMENTSFIFQTTPFDEISNRLLDLTKIEKPLKSELKLLIDEEMITKNIDKETISSLRHYTSETLEYFHTDKYNDENLQLLFLAISSYQQLVYNKYFEYKKNILVFQKQLEN